MYVQFKKHTRLCNLSSTVTLGKRGNIYINSFVMRNYFAGVKHVFLLFDEDNKSFALKPAKGCPKGAYPLRFVSEKTKSMGYVAVRGFLNLFFVYEYSCLISAGEKNKRIKAIWNKDEKMLEVSLK
jgi:hypothetical protein